MTSILFSLGVSISNINCHVCVCIIQWQALKKEQDGTTSLGIHFRWASKQIVKLKWSFLKVEIIAVNFVIQGTNGITGAGNNHKMIQIQLMWLHDLYLLWIKSLFQVFLHILKNVFLYHISVYYLSLREHTIKELASARHWLYIYLCMFILQIP